MIDVGILPARLTKIQQYDAAFREFLYELRFAHSKRLEFSHRLRRQQDVINAQMAVLRRGNVYTKTFRIDLIV